MAGEHGTHQLRVPGALEGAVSGGGSEHRQDPSVRIVESDEDVLLYQQGHVPGAVKIDWHTDLQDQIVRDYIDKDRFAKLCSSKGIAHDTTSVFSGDQNR